MIKIVYVDDNEHTCNKMRGELEDTEIEVIIVKQYYEKDDEPSKPVEKTAKEIYEEITRSKPDIVLIDMFRENEKEKLQNKLFKLNRLELLDNGTGLQSEELVNLLRKKEIFAIIVISDYMPTDALESHFSRRGADWVLHKATAFSLKLFFTSFVKRYYKKRRLVIIEDNIKERGDLKELLESIGFRVQFPTVLDENFDEELAWNYLKEKKGQYDHVILDLLLKETKEGKQAFAKWSKEQNDLKSLELFEKIAVGSRGGLNILARRQDDPDLKGVPFIVLTHYGGAKSVRRVLRGLLHATDVFWKNQILLYRDEQMYEDFIGLLRRAPDELIQY
jgi:CheY-like chemotaxis protein